jgi:hypothetical protein
MKLAAVTAVGAAVLGFGVFQAPPVLAQAPDIGAASRPYPLTGGPPAESDKRGQSSGEQSDGRSGEAGSGNGEAGTGKTGETPVRGRRFAIHRHGRRFMALNHPRHHLLIHKHGHRIATLTDRGGA